jgi:hypothetical protein
MQSVSLKKPLTFLRSAQRRQSPQFLIAVLIAVGMLPWAVPSHAQDTPTAPAATPPHAQDTPTAPTATPPRAQDTQTVLPAVANEKFDIGVGGFYQVTNASNGNFIREDTTESYGPLVSFRQPYRPWLGYEANVGFTSFFEAYNKGVVKLKSNDTDFSVSYLLQSPVIYGIQPFLTLGGGIIYFSPTGTVTNTNSATPSHLSSQLLPEFTYGIGLNYPILAHFGARVQLRGLKYKTPDFHQLSLDTHTLRTTLEPTISVYYRF